MSIPGISSAQRFKYTGATMKPELASPWTYLALYGIDGDPRQALDNLRARKLVIPASITDTRSWVFTPISPVVVERGEDASS